MNIPVTDDLIKILMAQPFPCDICGTILPLDELGVDTSTGEKICDACEDIIPTDKQ
jgi:hypothetical protein